MRSMTDEGSAARTASLAVGAPSFEALIRPDFVGPPSPASREKGSAPRALDAASPNGIVPSRYA
jgi:hypothetical protein